MILPLRVESITSIYNTFLLIPMQSDLAFIGKYPVSGQGIVMACERYDRFYGDGQKRVISEMAVTEDYIK